MDLFLYVQEEYDNVRRALEESLRYDYGPGQTVDYYDECRFRLDCIRIELERLRESGSGSIPQVISQLSDLANRLTLIERSHLGEFSWPFADAIRKVAISLLLEDDDLKGEAEPIIHMIAEGTSYQISSEQILTANKRRRLHTVAFPRQLKHHVLMHALFGHELGHATFYTSRAATPFGLDSLSQRVAIVLRREGPLCNTASTMAWLKSTEAPELVQKRMKQVSGSITESSLEHWLVELVCDLFGLAIFGPSFAAAHRTFLEPSCRTHYEFEIEKKSHPAYALRHNVLVGAMRVQGWLVPVAASATANASIRDAEIKLINYIGGEDFGPWATVFTDNQLGEAMNIIAEHFQITGTSFAKRPCEKTLDALVCRIVNHLPPIREDIDEEGISTTHEIRLEEQLYAGWAYWLGREQLDKSPLSFYQLNQLCDLALLQQQAIELSSERRSL